MGEKFVTLRLLETKRMQKAKGYVVGGRNYKPSEKLKKEIGIYGLQPVNLDPYRRNILLYLRAKAVIIDDLVLDGKHISREEKVAKMTGKTASRLSEILKANAKKANEEKKRVLGFIDRAVANKKIRFGSDDPALGDFLKITDEIGVIWKEEVVVEEEDDPCRIKEEEIARFYIYKSERDGYLFGIRGGNDEYYENSGEVEISPEEFFQAVKEYGILDLISNKR